MRLHYIYVIRCLVSDYIYVGKTVNLKNRWKGHKGDAKRGDQRHLYRSMRLYGVENFTIEIVAVTLDAEFSLELEKTIISQFRVDNQLLYNHNNGGNSQPKLPNKDTCEKISIRLKQIWANEEKRKHLGKQVKLALADPNIHVKLGSKGDKHPLAKLTNDDIIAIRHAYHIDNVSAPTLAKQYGVCRNVLWRVAVGQLWSHLPMPNHLRKSRRPK